MHRAEKGSRVDHAEDQTIAVFVGGYPPAFRGGGPIRAVHALVSSCPDGLRPLVITSDRDLGSTQRLPVANNCWTEAEGSRIYFASLDDPGAIWRAFGAVRAERPDYLHFNSFFHPTMTILPLLLWRLGFFGSARVLLSPRGEFATAALTRSHVKKALWKGVFGLLRLQRRIVWHVTAPHEAEDLRREWGEDCTIIRSSDPVSLPNGIAPPPSTSATRARAVSLSRIVEHKGLHIVLEALAGASDELQLDIYGTSEDAQYEQRCRDLASRLPDGVSVAFKGELDHADVTKTLSSYDILLFPTASENFGYVVPEALSVSCPVMAPPTTPWTALLQSGAGVVVADRDPLTWATAIAEYLRLNPEERSALRRRAGDLFQSWLADQTSEHVWLQLAHESQAREQHQGVSAPPRSSRKKI